MRLVVRCGRTSWFAVVVMLECRIIQNLTCGRENGRYDFAPTEALMSQLSEDVSHAAG